MAMVFIKKQMSVVHFCCVVIRSLQGPHTSSKLFSLLGRLYLLMRHTVEFTGRENLALFDLFL